MTRATAVVCATLLLACAKRPAPVIESRCQCTQTETCRRAKWQALIDVAVAAAAQQGIACSLGCSSLPITQKQATAIVDWYCTRDAAKPRSDLLWMASDEQPIGEDEFWTHAKAGTYDVRYGSWVGASRDRDTFAYELHERTEIATKVTLDVILGGGDSGPMPFWVHYYFDARDHLVGVNVGAGSACPFIATSFDGGAFVEHGEILTDLRRPALEATQRLATTGPAHCTHAIVRVLERKPETTYLDSLELDLGGVRLAPAGCPGAAYCADDGAYHRLERDQSIDIAFELPPGTDCRTAHVVANGYYVPY